MTSKTDLEKKVRMIDSMFANVDLELSSWSDGERRVYSLAQDLPDGGMRQIGPAGYAAEFEMYLRGIDFGSQLATGRYDE